MKRLGSNASDSGFAAVETVLVAIVVTIMIGVGVYVYKNRSNGSIPLAETSVTAQSGTTDMTTQLDNLEVNQEKSVDGSYDSQVRANAVSDGTAMSDLGGAGDESDF